MARIPRVEVIGFPHHVTQRGNRRHQTFFSNADYRAYLKLIEEAKSKAGVSVWAYCLMPNHVHFVVVPSRQGGLAGLVQHPHRRYAWRVNRRMNWEGHLWQSRFYSCPMDEEHLIAAVRYVELNPVRAGLCNRPEDWPWSSVRAHLGCDSGLLVDARPMLDRVGCWHEYLGQSASQSLVAAIRDNSMSGRPAGSDEFVRMIEKATGRRLRRRRPGPVSKRFRN